MKNRSDVALVVVIVLALGGILAGFFIGGKSYTPLTKANFAESVSNAGKSTTSMHMSATSAQLAVTGDFSLVEPMAALISFGKAGAAAGQTVDMEVVGGKSYLRLPGLQGKWFQTADGSESATEEQIRAMGQIGSGAQFLAGLESVTYVGEDTVNGQKVQHYTLVVNSSQLGTAITDLAQTTPAFKDLKTVTEQVYLSDENVIQRLVVNLPAPAGDQTTDFKWNQPVNIKAPAASDVIAAQPSATPTP